VASPSTTTRSSTKCAKGKRKTVDSDVDSENDEGGRVAPSSRLELARRELYKKDPKFRQRVQAEEPERELEALLAEMSNESDTETETAVGPAKELANTAPAANQPPTANKPSTATKSGRAASRSTKIATIQDGSITKAARAK
jgi:hypothetical protein